LQFLVNKKFFIIVGVLFIVASAIFMIFSAAVARGWITFQNAPRVSAALAIISGIFLVTGVVGIEMLLRIGHNIILGFALLGQGFFFFIYFGDPYDAFLMLIGIDLAIAGGATIFINVFLYRFFRGRIEFSQDSLDAHMVSQTLGFYGFLAGIFIAFAAVVAFFIITGI